MFAGLMDIAGSLNERYNLTKKARVWSNIDVPGFVRSRKALALAVELLLFNFAGTDTTALTFRLYKFVGCI